MLTHGIISSRANALYVTNIHAVLAPKLKLLTLELSRYMLPRELTPYI